MKTIRRPAALIDVLDRVIDKGIVFDAWTPRPVEGIELRPVDIPAVETPEAAYRRGVADGLGLADAQRNKLADQQSCCSRLVVEVVDR